MFLPMRILPLLLLPALVSATPFRPADLPAGSAWFLHVDHDAVRSAPLGATLMSQPIDDAACPLPPKAKAFLEETGFDYRRDLRAFTVFGRKALALGGKGHAASSIGCDIRLAPKGAERTASWSTCKNQAEPAGRSAGRKGVAETKTGRSNRGRMRISKHKGVTEG